MDKELFKLAYELFEGVIPARTDADLIQMFYDAMEEAYALGVEDNVDDARENGWHEGYEDGVEDTEYRLQGFAAEVAALEDMKQRNAAKVQAEAGTLQAAAKAFYPMMVALHEGPDFGRAFNIDYVPDFIVDSYGAVTPVDADLHTAYDALNG